jgi:hypothetical protein
MGENQGDGVAVDTRDDPRWIAIRVSRVNLAVTLVGAAMAFPALFLVPIAPGARAALLVALLLAMTGDLVLALLRLPSSVVAFYLIDLDRLASAGASEPGPAQGIRIRQRGRRASPAGPEREGVVLAGSFVTPWFTALRYRLPRDAAWRRAWPRVIPLWPDSIAPDEFRRTRVALKWK